MISNYKYLQLKQFIDDIAIILYFSRNVTSMENIRKIYNSMADLSKFTSNKKILNKIVILVYNQFCR